MTLTTGSRFRIYIFRIYIFRILRSGVEICTPVFRYWRINFWRSGPYAGSVPVLHSGAFLLCLLLLTGCGERTETQSENHTGNRTGKNLIDNHSEPGYKWVGTWNTSLQLVEPHNMPPDPGLNGNTIRQVVRVSLGGEQLRLSVSNEYGSEPLETNAVHIAASTGDGTIDSTTNVSLTFNGETSVNLQPGEAITSDPFTFHLEPQTDVAITMHFGSVPSEITGHPGSRTTSRIVPGNAISSVKMPDAVRAERWYFIDGIDVMAPDSAFAVVTLGNSITDGRGSGTDRQNRWPDELANRLQSDPETRHIAILNQGIGGNCVLRSCLGPSALARFERDVLNQAGARVLIILHGINDIGGISDSVQAEAVVQDLIGGYRQMTDLAHERNMLVYGATLLPFGASFYDNPESERARRSINEWIRTAGIFDAVIDFDRELSDPDNPYHLLPEADTGDHLHPNEAGYRLMAEVIDLSLFKSIRMNR